jgi:glucokinase
MSELRECVVAVDIGGTTLKSAVFDRAGRVLAACTRPTFGVNDSPADSLRALLRQHLDLLRADGRHPAAVGISCPGMVDTGRGVVVSAVNLGWSGLPLRAQLTEEFGLPVSLEHDARAAALGEQAAQACRAGGGGTGPLRDFAFIPIGTGIAAAIVAGGQLVTGTAGAAGEFGHIPVVPGGRQCACGQRGCIEAHASGPAVRARFQEIGGDQRSTAEIAASAGHDRRAGQVWAEAIDALTTGLVALVALTDPAAVIIGGGVARAGAALLKPLDAALSARLTWRAQPRLLLSMLGPRAGLIGAGLCGWTGPASAHPGAAASFSLTALAELAATAPQGAAHD